MSWWDKVPQYPRVPSQKVVVKLLRESCLLEGLGPLHFSQMPTPVLQAVPRPHILQGQGGCSRPTRPPVLLGLAQGSARCWTSSPSGGPWPG